MGCKAVLLGDSPVARVPHSCGSFRPPTAAG